MENKTACTKPFRPAITGTRHMIAAGHFGAAHAGFCVLEAGGNAVDAGVAAGICLGVLQTDIVNFAGVAPIMLWLAERRKLVTIDGLGVWPKAARLDVFHEKYEGRMPPGLLRTVVPAAPDSWITALELYGTMSFGDVAQAAIRYARDGFAMHPLMADYITEQEEAYRRWPANAAVYLPGGKPPAVNDLFVQAELAKSLQYMADEERAHAGRGRVAGLAAARAAFYRGDIGRAIARYHRDNGGWLTEDDLASFRVRHEQPVRTRFRDLDVYACGPWCQGPVTLQTLNILAGLDLEQLGHNSPEYLHALIEALKLAFADRHRYYGDPAFVNVPMEQLLSAAFAGERRQRIDMQRAHPGMPDAGSIAGWNPTRFDLPLPTRGDPAPPADTSYVCVIDRHGNAFSATPSDESSAMPLVPGTGLVPSSRGSQSWTDPRHPACLAPGKRPRLTPSPGMVFKNGALYMPYGSPGNDIQPQAMAQTLLNISVFGMDPQSAVEAPRIGSYSYPGSSEPHAYHPARVMIDDRFPRITGEALSARGHDVGWWPHLSWKAGGVCTIVRDPKTGILSAGADPRRPAYALGW
jgi:gamma-glutamyltranspeptidase/glutathione hydrolase